MPTPAARVEDLKYILSDGPNSVTDILNAVLRVDPSQRDAHYKLQADVANVYAERARPLANERRVTEALDLIRYGRRRCSLRARSCSGSNRASVAWMPWPTTLELTAQIRRQVELPLAVESSEQRLINQIGLQAPREHC